MLQNFLHYWNKRFRKYHRKYLQMVPIRQGSAGSDNTLNFISQENRVRV